MSRRARLAFFAVAAAALAVTLGVGLAGLPSFGSQLTSYARMLNELASPQRHVTDVVSFPLRLVIDLVPDDGLVLQHLRDNLQTVNELILSQPEEKLTYSCAPGEWTIKEIVGHIIDCERVFAYRALRFARNDSTELPGFDENMYAVYADSNERSTEDLVAEWTAVRLSTVALFSSFTEEVFLRSGTTNGHRTSVRALAYQIAGQALHHLNSIKENYLDKE